MVIASSAIVMPLVVVSPVYAAGSLFANPQASDSAYAPIEGTASKASQIRSNDDSALQEIEQKKRQQRAGDASILNSMRSDLANTANTINNSLNSTNASITNLSNSTSNALSTLSTSTSQGLADVANAAAQARTAQEASMLASVSQIVAASEQNILGAVAIQLGNDLPQTFEFASAQALTPVTTMPYDGKAVMTIVGGGAGGNAGYSTSMGYGGAAGQVVDGMEVTVAKGTPISVEVGAGGAGAVNTGQTPGSGGLSRVVIGGVSYVAQGGAGSRQFGCKPGSSVSVGNIGLIYRTSDLGDGAIPCSGGYGDAAVGGNFVKSKGATGGGAVVRDYYAKSGSLSTLGGQSDARLGGGGAGGAAALAYVPSRGFYQDPIYGDSGPGNYYIPGSGGAAGYVQVRLFNPNEILTKQSLINFVKAGGTADANINIAETLASLGSRNAIGDGGWSAYEDLPNQRIALLYNGSLAETIPNSTVFPILSGGAYSRVLNISPGPCSYGFIGSTTETFELIHTNSLEITDWTFKRVTSGYNGYTGGCASTGDGD